MRLSQSQGLPLQAEEFLKVNAVKINECQHCHRDDGYDREVIGSYGISSEHNLYRYTLMDGSSADECVQAEIWCSGPMTWLCLKWKGSFFQWANEDMTNQHQDRLRDPKLKGG